MSLKISPTRALRSTGSRSAIKVVIKRDPAPTTEPTDKLNESAQSPPAPTKTGETGPK